MKFAKLDTLDDELNYKRVKIKISSSKHIHTPIKASNHLNPVSTINEMYGEFSTDSLDKIMKGEDYERQANARIKKLKNVGLNLLYVNYTGQKIPDKEYLETLSDIQYAHSDVVIPPLFSRIVTDLKENELLEKFISLTNESLEITRTLNNKPVMGVIPAVMPRQFLKPIIKNYVKQGITCFAVDLHGRSVDSNMSWARSLMRLMAEYDLSEDSFLYALNCNAGRFIKNSDKILAKDFISIGCGMDILGINHIGLKLNTVQWQKLKNQRKTSTLRIFDRDDYAYIKTSESEVLDQFSCESCGIRDEIKKWNMESQFKESILLQEKLKEKNSLEPYIESKDQVTSELIKNMKLLRKDAFDHLNYVKIDKYFD